MANRYSSAVLFAMEKNVTFLALRAVFQANGTVSLDAINSKGIASLNPYTETFTGNTTGSSATITSVSNFTGLYVGQTITGTAFGSTVTIASISASAGGSITLSSGTGVAPSNAGAIFATGGQYIVQFGLSNGNRLDTYHYLMYSAVEFRETTASAQSATTQAYFPAASDYFVIKNNTGVRTIPTTATTASTDAALIFQLGNVTSNNLFTAATPQAGETMHMYFVFSNSTAI